ncbi:sodium channel protein type 9 subunit alpha-like [Trichosurus vulpecula]|uniref:sodium channel protein type 9 subunit alpha-like n=1 Tax=Trichosurus vulpecula TaxID=9337 RepID=UPI00186AFF12|nr:sodium channel protein type 9 subunit alpha-like [Trichosurus vulpecula]
MAKPNNLTYFTRKSLVKEHKSDRSDEEEEELEPRSDLEAGKQLPFIYGDVPPEMVSEPLEELDPYYRDKNTFLVLNERKMIFRFNATPALYILPPFNLIRRLSIKVLVNVLFNMFIMGTFMINCFFLTMCTSPTWAKTLKLLFIGLYTFEILIQIMARGFIVGPFTFLNDPWSLFDIPILTMAYLSIFVNLGYDSALGIFSILRIVKSVSLTIGKKSVVGTLTRSVKMVSQTVILTMFCLSVFAVMGMQLFMGKLKQKCLRWPRGEGNITEIPWDNEGKYYFYYLEGQKDALLCGNSTYTGECPEGYMCVKASMNPDHNYTSFDNFGWAVLTLFRLMTLDYWENLYQQILRAAGKIYVIFFIVIILFCSFYLMTLILAVVIMAYEKQNRITIREAKKREIKYQALLCQQRREEKAQAMVAEGIAADERVVDQNIELLENSSEASQCSSKNDNGRMDQRKKKNQEDQTDIEEREIDLKLHRFETEEHIRRKLCHHGIKKQRLTNKSKLPSPQQGRTSRKDQKEGQINSCCVSMDILDDPTIRQRAMRKTNVINRMERLDESRPTCANWWHRFSKTDMIWNCSPPWLKCKDFIYTIVMDPFFELAIATCVITNIIFMAMDHHPMTEKFYNMLSVGNLVFTGIYTAEMFLKIIAVHPCNYFQIGWNILDSFIVLLALVELYISKIYALSFLRSFRLLRIFKLAKYWPTCERLIKIVVYSVKALQGLLLVLFITLFIFAVVGMQQFGESCQEHFCNPGVDCAFPRWHMNDFLHAFLLMFQVLCGEWIEPMWDCMNIASQGKCLVFFVMMVVIGKMLLLILFVALLSSFSSENFAAIQVSPESNNLQRAMERIQKGIHYVKRTLLDLITKACSKKQMISNDIKREENLNMEKNNVTSNHTVNDMNKNFQNHKDRIHSIGISLEKYAKNKSDSPSLIPNPSFLGPAPIAVGESDFENICAKEFKNELDTESSKENLRRSSSSEDSMVPILAPGEEEQAVEKPLKSDEPGACFTYGCIRRFPYCEANVKSRKGKIWWNLRKTCYRTVKHGCFEISIVLIIFLSSTALIFEDIYIEKRKTIKIILEYGDMIFTYIFILEMLLKWMAYGYKTYFSNVWCWLEFLVVNVSLLSLVANYLGYSKLAPLKSLRMLRILSVYEEVRVVLHIFLKAVPSILKALLVCLMSWLFFSLMGVNLFAGKFFECVNTTTGERLSRTIVSNFSECKTLINSSGDVQWKNGKANFDNVGNGYLSLLQLATFQGWLDIMNAAIDSVDVESQPEYESNLYVYLYFVSFIIFGLFFPLVFFVSVVVNHFKQQIKNIGGLGIFMTENRKKYYNLMKKLGHGKPQNPIPRPRNKFQRYIFDLVTKDAFEITIIVFICLNMVTMMVETDTQSAYTSNILYQINLVFIGFFVGECVLKLIGLRQYYFTIGWNVFDFVVVHLSIMVVLLPRLTDKYLLTYAEVQVIRLIRCGRVLNFIKGTKGLGLLIYALMLSLPTLLNIVLLLFLVMFIYAVIGMSHFAFVKKDAGINDMFNFETFGNSILCLFQITTFAGWDGLLAPILNTGPPDCDPQKIHPGSSVKGDCGSPSLGILYFVSYITISFLVLVNMFIVVILEICSVVTEDNAQPLSEEAFDNFYEVWKQFDPNVTHFIDYSQLSDFAASLDPPLLIAKPNRVQLIAMDLPIVRGDRVFCTDVLIAFTKYILGEGEAFGCIHLPMRKQFLSSCLFQISYEPVSTTLKRKQEEVSALIIQRAFRRFCIRQNVLGIYNIKGEDRENLTIKEDIVFDKVQNSPLEKGGDLSPSPTSIHLDSGIEQDREKHETDQTEKEDKGKNDGKKEK